MHVLITAGPTREYLDDVRFLTNASSGRMGYALAECALRRGWRVSLVTGPVTIPPPPGAGLHRVTGALEMLDTCLDLFSNVDGVIAVAAVADFRPATRASGKLHRSGGGPLMIEFVPNPDILAELGRRKSRQWTVGFAVETSDAVERARGKLALKNCDAVVVNDPQAMESPHTAIRLIDRAGNVSFEFQGPKQEAAERILEWIANHLAKQPPD